MEKILIKTVKHEEIKYAKIRNGKVGFQLLNSLAFFVFSESPGLVCITYLFNVISVMASTSFSLNILHLLEVKKMLIKTEEILMKLSIQNSEKGKLEFSYSILWHFLD